MRMRSRARDVGGGENRRGLDDLRSLPSKNALAPVLALASEAVLAGLGLSRTVVFVRQANDEFHARLGLGPNVERMLPALQFAASSGPTCSISRSRARWASSSRTARDPRIEAARLPPLVQGSRSVTRGPSCSLPVKAKRCDRRAGAA